MFVIKLTPEQIAIVRKFSSIEGYCSIFDQNLLTSRTMVEAYETTEDAHEYLFGYRRYSEYKHFCRARRKFLDGGYTAYRRTHPKKKSI